MIDRKMCLLPWVFEYDTVGKGIYKRYFLGGRTHFFYILKYNNYIDRYYSNNVLYDSEIEAKNAMDKYLIDKGYVLLTEEMALLV
jgi:hypothetical protein